MWIEKLENNPGKYIPEALRKAGEGEAVRVDLNRPMKRFWRSCQYRSRRVSPERHNRRPRHRPCEAEERTDNGEGLPQYIKDHPIYYAGPAKTPEVMPPAH